MANKWPSKMNHTSSWMIPTFEEYRKATKEERLKELTTERCEQLKDKARFVYGTKGFEWNGTGNTEMTIEHVLNCLRIIYNQFFARTQFDEIPGSETTFNLTKEKAYYWGYMFLLEIRVRINKEPRLLSLLGNETYRITLNRITKAYGEEAPSEPKLKQRPKNRWQALEME